MFGGLLVQRLFFFLFRFGLDHFLLLAYLLVLADLLHTKVDAHTEEGIHQQIGRTDDDPDHQFLDILAQALEVRLEAAADLLPAGFLLYGGVLLDFLNV